MKFRNLPLSRYAPTRHGWTFLMKPVTIWKGLPRFSQSLTKQQTEEASAAFALFVREAEERCQGDIGKLTAREAAETAIHLARSNGYDVPFSILETTNIIAIYEVYEDCKPEPRSP